MKTHAASAFRQVRRFLRVDQAVSALEYAILVGVIAVAIGAALVTFSDNLTDGIEAIGGKVKAIDTGTVVAKKAADS